VYRFGNHGWVCKVSQFILPERGVCKDKIMHSVHYNILVAYLSITINFDMECDGLSSIKRVDVMDDKQAGNSIYHYN
jgi:hypothetical protein